MPIHSGSRLRLYEILSVIGAGNMGEVYQAHETKPGRDPAIKAVPGAFAHNARGLAHFQREARTLVSLKHPNIAKIHGREQSRGTSYLVIEYVPGETLQGRVKRDNAPAAFLFLLLVSIYLLSRRYLAFWLRELSIVNHHIILDLLNVNCGTDRRADGEDPDQEWELHATPHITIVVVICPGWEVADRGSHGCYLSQE